MKWKLLEIHEIRPGMLLAWTATDIVRPQDEEEPGTVVGISFDDRGRPAVWLAHGPDAYPWGLTGQFWAYQYDE